MRKIRVLVATLALAAVSMAGSAGAAVAAEQNWTWKVTGGNRIATASYTDSGDIVRVNDMEKDGHSALLEVWRVGHRSGVHVYCWDSTGYDGPGVACKDAFKGTGWGANAKLKGRVCIGESGPGPKGGKILKCQPKAGWKTFYR